MDKNRLQRFGSINEEELITGKNRARQARPGKLLLFVDRQGTASQLLAHRLEVLPGFIDFFPCGRTSDCYLVRCQEPVWFRSGRQAGGEARCLLMGKFVVHHEQRLERSSAGVAFGCAGVGIGGIECSQKWMLFNALLH